MTDSLIITIVQTQLHWEDKKANLKMLGEKIGAIKNKTGIIVLPEMFSTGFSMQPEKLAETMDSETLHWMKEIAAEKKSILTGSFICKDVQDGQPVYYNRLIWMRPDGEYGVYDKRHLFAFAGEDNHYTPGKKRLIASVNGWKINLLICYDLRFPVWSRQSPVPDNKGEAEYDVMIFVANWPEKRNTAWKALLQARAIENQSYVVGVNRVGKDGNDLSHCGDSMVIDPLGEILVHLKDEEDIYTITLDKSHLQKIREKFPFWRDADKFRVES